ncbi:DUF7288 family protein [Halegenticoccus soli]|uniref:DUF7288 family protein n=1 Tax=Halegenticoccus soli TaxID=1985678 RepID=UPI000C6EE4D1|nr:hypothetical protein [Halegenticoccus soli]
MSRAQAHTLEAITAAALLLASVVFALQVTAVTPLTASTSSQHIENQHGALAEGVLLAAEENGTLKPTLLYGSSAGTYHGTNYRGAYTHGGPPTDFGRALNGTFGDAGVAFNVNVHYLEDAGGTVETRRMVYFGQPSDHAVSATRTVTLYDDDVRYDESERPTTTTLAAMDGFYAASDTAPNSPVFNVVAVEVVVWRM